MALLMNSNHVIILMDQTPLKKQDMGKVQYKLSSLSQHKVTVLAEIQLGNEELQTSDQPPGGRGP